LNETVLVEGVKENYNEKWTAYYNRAIKEESFEIEEHFYHPSSNEVQYNQVTFKFLVGGDDKIFAVACQSIEIASVVKQQSKANQLIDASLDVF